MKQNRMLVSIVAAMALTLAGATDLSAQYRERGRRASAQNAFGIGLTLINPVGEFANYVDIGGGLELYGLIGLGRNSPFPPRQRVLRDLRARAVQRTVRRLHRAGVGGCHDGQHNSDAGIGTPTEPRSRRDEALRLRYGRICVLLNPFICR